MVNTYRHVFGKVLEAVERGQPLVFEHDTSITRPVFDIWYGDVQHFGLNGHPQRWVNILGHVAPAESVESLTYSLNGGRQQALSFREDFKRPAKTGDFNVEIDRAVLQPGENRLVLCATTRTGGRVEHVVNIFYDSGEKKWPLPYKIDWKKVSKIEDVAQVADGKWKVTDQGVSKRGEKFYMGGHLFDIARDPDELHPIDLNSIDNEALDARDKLRAVLDKLK